MLLKKKKQDSVLQAGKEGRNGSCLFLDLPERKIVLSCCSAVNQALSF